MVYIPKCVSLDEREEFLKAAASILKTREARLRRLESELQAKEDALAAKERLIVEREVGLQKVVKGGDGQAGVTVGKVVKGRSLKGGVRDLPTKRTSIRSRGDGVRLRDLKVGSPTPETAQ